MKPFRLFLYGAGTVAVLLLAAGVVAFSSSFQTWAARRVIAAQPGMKATVGSVSAGLKRVEASALRFEQGGAILTVPSVVIAVPVWSAGWKKQVFVSNFVAKGWTLDLTQAGQVSGVPSGPASLPATAQSATAVARAFSGVFAQLILPIDVSAEGVELEGEVILPESRGRVRVMLKGGGLGSAREGKFDLTALAALSGAEVKTVEVRGTLTAAMDTPRTFTRLAARLDAAASGEAFATGVKLQANLAAARAAKGESYSAAVVTEGREILGITAEFPRGAKKLDGAWKLDVRDGDIAPFALGKSLPAFTAAGQGRFDSDADFKALQVIGRLDATADRLQAVKVELAALGAIKLSADFDLATHGGAIAVRKFEASVVAAQPVATLRTKQAFEFRPATGELTAADPAREVFGLALQGLPVAWTKPYLKNLEMSGGHVRGEFAAAPRNGGMTLRSVTPIVVDDLTVGRTGMQLVQGVALSLGTTADYTPQGWQVEVLDGMVKRDGVALLSLEGKAGQLSGKDGAIKATGRLLANLPGWGAQPLAAGNLALTSGEALVNFTASLGATTEVQANVGVRNLAAVGDAGAVKLPALSLDLRADVAADGRIAFSAPIGIERDGRKSDLVIAGTLDPEKEKSRAIDAQVTSKHLVIDDASSLGAAVSARPGDKNPPISPTRDAAPPWAGLHGALTLQLENVVYSDSFRATQVKGRLRIDAGTVKLESMQGGLVDGGRANLKGAITFNAVAPRPYAAQADLAVHEFNPGPLLRALGGDEPATVEGKFDVKSRLSAEATSLGGLAAGTAGEFQFTSRGGVFRGLPVSVSNPAESMSRLASIIASAGSVFGGFSAKKDYAEIGSRPEAVAELARGWNRISFDQLSVVVSRDAAMNTTVKNFTLISPELRLSGSGTALRRAAGRPIDESLVMEYSLRARGRQAELLKFLGVMDAHPDDLGYAACTVPLRVAGTLGKPDPGELNTKLAALALEKPGLTDKAADFLNKLRGAGK